MHLPIIVHVPMDTPADATVFLAGSLPSVGSWKADGVQMARAADGTYSGSLTLEAGQTLDYKLTRGSWDAVEKAADGSDRANRELNIGVSDRTDHGDGGALGERARESEHRGRHPPDRASARHRAARAAHDPRLAAAGV